MTLLSDDTFRAEMQRAWADVDDPQADLWWDDLFLCWTCAKGAAA